MSDSVIRVEGVSKAYRLGVQRRRSETLLGAVASTMARPLRNLRQLRQLDTFGSDRDADDILWALRDVSFEIARGEAVGFVGRNGAGKSTLLKILSRISQPTSGRVEMRGRVSSLLEVGTGFHPELTGRENVYMNGTILGMRKREIDRKFDAIVEFSGVERFLDTPVKRYSSGMKVRLGFSVAAHLEPDVLIVDEVLAVGDAEFQRKCLGKMQDVAGHGRTVLFVSHNTSAVQSFCSRAIGLQGGRIVSDGETGEVISDYMASMSAAGNDGFALDNPERLLVGDIYLTGGRLLDARGQPTTHVTAGEPATIELEYVNPNLHPGFEFAIEIRNNRGIGVFHLSPGYVGYPIRAAPRGSISCTLPRLSLPVGSYTARTALNIFREKSDHIPAALRFEVHASTFFPTGGGPSSAVCSALAEQIWDMNGVDPRGRVGSDS